MINMVKRTTYLQTVPGSLEVYQQKVDAHQLPLAKLWLLWLGPQPSAFWTQGAKPKASDVTEEVLVTLMVPSLRFGEVKDVIGNGANVSMLKHAISIKTDALFGTTPFQTQNNPISQSKHTF